MGERIIVERTNLAAVQVEPDTAAATVELDAGELRLAVDRFGLSSNNISYAMFGDALGYWAHFPVDDAHGCVPVWGFAEVVESTRDDVPVGERLFGYLPMATHVVVGADAVTSLSLADATAHRAGLHPWYTRLYRCSSDPVYSPDREALQVVMWALFMTGWALAAELAASVRYVVVSSASSKTSTAMAWALQQIPEVTVVGVTSASNVDLVEASGVYDVVTTYDDLAFDAVEGECAFVDTAGSPGIKQRVHDGLGARLVDSVLLGATHQGAGEAVGELGGPAPRFFFIPDVAEQRAAAESDPTFHERFAAAWHEFAPWFEQRVRIESGVGVDAVTGAYRRVLAGEVAADEALVLSW